MGFIMEKYSNGNAGLVVSFAKEETSSDFFAGDSIEAAIQHFGLYLDEDNHLRIDSESERAMEALSIEPSQAQEFRAAMNEILASLDDETADINKLLFPLWNGNSVAYTVGERVRYNAVLYKVLQAHTSQSDWTPDVAVSLFARCIEVATDENGNPTDEIPEWVQPNDTNPYNTGDKVKYNDKVYESLINNNVWSPEAYPQGWQEIEE